MLYTESMSQFATYWPPGANDGFGTISFEGVQPQLIRCRWQNIAKLFRDAQGREAVSAHIVYVASEVVLRGMLALGDYTGDSGAGTGVGAGVDPRSLAGAREIRGLDRSPSLAADQELLKAYL